MRLLPNAGAIIEFLGYNGDCGEAAELAALHVYSGLALNAANLNAIVQREIRDHEASPNGSEAINAIAQDLTELKVPHNLINYHEPFGYDWRSLLRAKAGINAIILEFANAQALPGDERGLHYHFVCVVGVDDNGVYIVADGDNPASRSGQLVHYSEAQLAAAVVCGVIEVIMPTLPASGPLMWGHFNIDAQGEWIVAPGHPTSGMHIRGGILAAYKTWNANGSFHGLTALGLPLANEQAVPGKPNCWWQPFERGTLIFDRDRIIDNPPGAVGDVYAAHVTYHP